MLRKAGHLRARHEILLKRADEGVLLFDPLEYRAEPILAAIRSVTDLPVTTIVYSHNHADHIGGTSDFLNLLADQETAPRILASQETADKMERLGSSLPRPTETIAWPDGSYSFEGLTIELNGFAHAGHTEDHGAWLLKEERVLHAPDLLNPDQPPFWSFAGSERFTYLTDNLKEANALEWTTSMVATAMSVRMMTSPFTSPS